MRDHECPECFARYATASDSCASRFEQLLALDHSRVEPWGSRHGQAFAAFALQHPMRHRASLDAAWTLLNHIYLLGEPVTVVTASLRRSVGKGADERVPPRSARMTAPEMTIADLGDFAAETYASRLDAWCRATLRSWGARLETK